PSSASCCWSPGPPACAGFWAWKLAQSFRRLLPHQGTHARDVAADLLQLAGVRQLLGGELHAQSKRRPQQAFELLRQLLAALAVAHADFGRLLRDRLVREHADPDAAAALDVARHRPAGSFQLPRRQPAAGGRLEAELAERDLGAAGRDPGIAAFLLLAIFGSC